MTPFLRLRALAAACQADLRVALRLFVKQPVFTAVVVTTLGLGIGLNTAVFSAVEAELLRPPPGVREADQLLRLFRTARGELWGSNSVRHVAALREQTGDVFSGVAAMGWRSMNMTVGDAARTSLSQIVTANYFSLLGVRPALGRVFVDEEDRGWGAHPVVVLSDGFWRDAFGADSGVIGREVPVNGRNVTIVGVAPAGFRGLTPIVEPAFWIPLTQISQVWPSQTGDPMTWAVNFLDVVARLKPGVTIGQARARLDALASAQRADDPDYYRERGIHVIASSQAGITPTMRQAEIGLFGVVFVVVLLLLMLACLNVANLFLARANDRSREMAIRLALGASRWQLVRQLLVESLLYAIVSAGAGLLLAWWATTLVNRLSLPMNLTVRPDLALRWPVLLMTAGITLLTTLVFGLWPALQATRPSLIPALKGESGAGRTRSRARRAMVVAQTALSVLLLVGAGAFLRNLQQATTVDKGFVSDGLVVASLDPSLLGYNRTATREFQQRLAERMLATPTVSSVSFVSDLPLGVSSSDSDVEVPGYVPQSQESMAIFYAAATPNYFGTLGLTIRGRDFRATDDSASVAVAVVNQRFVDRFWPGQDGVGKTVRFNGRDRTIIGVVPTGKYRRLGEDPTAFLWMPQSQYWRPAMSLVVRTTGPTSAVMAQVRRNVRALDANMPLGSLQTMQDHLGFALLPARMTAAALGAFGALGLLLAAIGIYGVTAYAVSQRTREIGIRLAIGASPTQVVRALIAEGMTLVGGGAVLGTVFALGATVALRSVLYDGGSAMWPTVAAVVALLLMTAGLATVLPARRASRVDPVIALRAD